MNAAAAHRRQPGAVSEEKPERPWSGNERSCPLEDQAQHNHIRTASAGDSRSRAERPAEEHTNADLLEDHDSAFVEIGVGAASTRADFDRVADDH